MAEDEIRKHGKIVYETLTKNEKGWQHKLKDILVEILIIVFAVSVSIWFHNWSESLKDRKQEKEFLIGLKEDVRADLNEMKGDSAAYQTVLKGALYFQKVGAGRMLSMDSLQHYGWIFFVNARKQSRTSRFEALKSSGKLDIIENKSLLADIISLYQEINPNIAEGDRQFSNYTTNTIGAYLDVHAKLDSNNNITNWLELIRDNQFRMALFRTNSIRDIITAYTMGIRKCEKIIKEIDEQTGKE